MRLIHTMRSYQIKILQVTQDRGTQTGFVLESEVGGIVLLLHPNKKQSRGLQKCHSYLDLGMHMEDKVRAMVHLVKCTLVKCTLLSLAGI